MVWTLDGRMVMKSSTWLVTGLRLTMCGMNLQGCRKSVLAALFTASVPVTVFMDVKGHMSSDQSAIQLDPTAISEPVPAA